MVVSLVYRTSPHDFYRQTVIGLCICVDLICVEAIKK
jgi:hypothetical protein